MNDKGWLLIKFGASSQPGTEMLADIKCFEKELHSEIEKIALMDELPKRWTYPDIQPYLINEAKRRGFPLFF